MIYFQIMTNYVVQIAAGAQLSGATAAKLSCMRAFARRARRPALGFVGLFVGENDNLKLIYQVRTSSGFRPKTIYLYIYYVEMVTDSFSVHFQTFSKNKRTRTYREIKHFNY